jgi:hypothetical protein
MIDLFTIRIRFSVRYSESDIMPVLSRILVVNVQTYLNVIVTNMKVFQKFLNTFTYSCTIEIVSVFEILC